MVALGTGLLWVGLGAAGDPRRLLVKGMNWSAASPLEGLLLSLGVEGHVPTVKALGQDGPEGGNKTVNGSEENLVQKGPCKLFQRGNFLSFPNNHLCFCHSDVEMRSVFKFRPEKVEKHSKTFICLLKV